MPIHFFHVLKTIAENLLYSLNKCSKKGCVILLSTRSLASFSIFIFSQALLLFIARHDVLFYLLQVGFFNLVKRARDQMNHLWVAETSENSSYSVYSSLSTTSHLNKTGECAQKWAKISCSVRLSFNFTTWWWFYRLCIYIYILFSLTVSFFLFWLYADNSKSKGAD